MRIIRYGVTLRRLTEGDIELVRQWRNDPKIRSFMLFRQEITPEMQQQWFESIDNSNNFYFLIEYKAKPIGLIDVNAINWEEGRGYSGLFIYEDDYIGSAVPVLASLNLVDTFFLLLGLDTLYAKILKSNYIAIRYNEELGFRFHRNIPENEEGVEYVLHKDDYLKKTRALHDLAAKTGQQELTIQLSERYHPFSEIVMRLNDSPIPARQRLRLQIRPEEESLNSVV